MAAGTALLCCTLLFVHVFVPADQKNINAESGQNVTLTCRASNSKINIVKWSRADLGDEYVLLYWDGYFVPDSQDPSFKNRVDRQMKDGDMSLILKDVTINDTGTYECRVFMEETWRWSTISIIYLHVLPPDQKIITAESGQDVTLTCRVPNNNIIVVKWSRDDLGDKYVLLYRDDQFVPDEQHPFFKNRVDLQDRQMKDGDVSLILKDVTINDAGTYECHVFMEETHSWDLSIIYLHVDPPDKHTTTPPPTSTPDGSTSITLPSPLSVLLPIGSVYVVVLLVLLVLLVRRCVHRKLEDGEDDITSSITYSVVKASNHQQPPVKETRERDFKPEPDVVYSSLK